MQGLRIIRTTISSNTLLTDKAVSCKKGAPLQRDALLIYILFGWFFCKLRYLIAIIRAGFGFTSSRL